MKILNTTTVFTNKNIAPLSSPFQYTGTEKVFEVKKHGVLSVASVSEFDSKFSETPLVLGTGYSLFLNEETGFWVVTLVNDITAGNFIVVNCNSLRNQLLFSKMLDAGEKIDLRVSIFATTPDDSNLTLRIYGDCGSRSTFGQLLYEKELTKLVVADQSNFNNERNRFLVMDESIPIIYSNTYLSKYYITLSSDNPADTAISGEVFVSDMSKSLDIATINNQEPLSDESIADAILGGTKQPINTDASGHVLIAGAKNALDDLNDFDAATESVGADIQAVKGTAVDGVGDFKADLSGLSVEIGALGTVISEVKNQTDKLDNMIIEDASGNIFTEKALENGSSEGVVDAVGLLIAATEANIRGTSGDTLKTLSGQIDTITGAIDNYLRDGGTIDLLIDAIKVQTDQIQFDSNGNIQTDASVDTSGLATQATLEEIKTQTDKIPVNPVAVSDLGVVQSGDSYPIVNHIIYGNEGIHTAVKEVKVDTGDLIEDVGNIAVPNTNNIENSGTTVVRE